MRQFKRHLGRRLVSSLGTFVALVIFDNHQLLPKNPSLFLRLFVIHQRFRRTFGTLIIHLKRLIISHNATSVSDLPVQEQTRFQTNPPLEIRQDRNRQIQTRCFGERDPVGSCRGRSMGLQGRIDHTRGGLADVLGIEHSVFSESGLVRCYLMRRQQE